MRQLPIFLNLAGQKLLLIGKGEMADAKERLYERAGATITDQENDPEVRLAVVALDNAEAAKVAAARLRGRGLLVNVVDHPELCDFTTPAIVDRDPVLIAIGTGGASAGLAKALRQRLEAILPQSLGQLAENLFGVREQLREKFPDARVRRNAIDEMLREGGPHDPFADTATINASALLSEAQDQTTGGFVEIELGSADPDDLTLRQARLLARADAIVVDPAVPMAITNRARADAIRVSPSEANAGSVQGLVVKIVMTMDMTGERKDAGS